MTDSSKYPSLRVFVFISLCPAFAGALVAFRFTLLIIYNSLVKGSRTEEYLLILFSITILAIFLLSVIFSVFMYSPPMIFLAIIIVRLAFRKTTAHLMLISALGGAAALGWCRLMLLLDARNASIYRNALAGPNFPVMTDEIIFVLGAVCSFAGAWFSLPKRVDAVINEAGEAFKNSDAVEGFPISENED